MSIEFMDVIQTVGSLVSLVLIPVWKSISDLKVIMAKDYMTKADCQVRHMHIDESIVRIHERIDGVNR
jgi:hypothetical protein